MSSYPIRLGYWDTRFKEVLYFPHDSHLILTSPAGTGKFRDVLSGLGGMHPGSLVWIDPKLQAGSVLARHIARTHDVVFLNPFGVLSEYIGAFPHGSLNPLDTLDPSEPAFEVDCDVIAEGIVTEQRNG